MEAASRSSYVRFPSTLLVFAAEWPGLDAYSAWATGLTATTDDS